MRECSIFVLPSLYEGLPLVLVEAAACGCRLVSTALPGVLDALAEPLRDALELVDVPRLRSIDGIEADDEENFVASLETSLGAALDRGPLRSQIPLETFTWRAVFRRIEAVWDDLSS